MRETGPLALAMRPFLDAGARLRKYLDDRDSRDPKAWRRAHPLQPPADKVVVRFIIPLISRTKAKDWEVVCRNLAQTLDALRRQTSPHWRATVDVSRGGAWAGACAAASSRALACVGMIEPIEY